MTTQKAFRTLVYSILVFTLIYLVHLTDFIFIPLGLLLAAIAVPVVGAGLLFYLTSPLVDFLEKHLRFPKKAGRKRIASILAVFTLILLVAYLSILFLIPPLKEQSARLADNLPAIGRWIRDMWQNRQDFLPAPVMESIQGIVDNLDTYANQVVGSLFDVIGSVFGFLLSLVMIPFFLFFMLKDGHKLSPFITGFFSEARARSLEKLLHDMHSTLKSFIQGQALVSLIVGILLFIGYTIVGLHYALVLALFGLVMNLIPFVGPWLAAFPAVIIGFFQAPMTGLWTIVVMLAAQQIEGSLISPNVMGKALHLHPLTIITVILAAGEIFGFLGLLVAVPGYAVAKTIITHFYRIYMASRPEGEKNLF